MSDLRLAARWSWHLRVTTMLTGGRTKITLPDPTKPVSCEEVNALELQLQRAFTGKKWRLDYDVWDFMNAPSALMRADKNKAIAVEQFDIAIRKNGIVPAYQKPRPKAGAVFDLFGGDPDPDPGDLGI